MAQLIDETGNQYGLWTVLKRAPNYSDGGGKWLCKCACGTIKAVSGKALRQSRSASCGCAKKLRKGIAQFNVVVSDYTRRAKKKGISFELSRDRFKELIYGKCFYCAAEPSGVANRHGYNGACVYNGVDRIDNRLGYVEGNVVTCCQQCNQAKSSFSQEEFYGWISRVYNYRDHVNR